MLRRKNLRPMVFRGKTLCMRLALNPADYAESKYVFEDISDVARFAAMPMLVRMTSERQVKYLMELLATLFDGIDIQSVRPSACGRNSRDGGGSYRSFVK